jgi:four helix bundle protein
MHNFKELIIWQKSMNLVKEVFFKMQYLPIEEKFGLQSQIQRSCISIPSNVAEGCGRSSDKDFARFLEIALSSAYELETQLILTISFKYFKEDELKNIFDELNQIQKMIFKFRSNLKSKV